MRVPMDLCHAPRAPTGLVPDRVISFLKVNAIKRRTSLSLPVSVPANSVHTLVTPVPREAGQCSRLVSPPLPAGVGCRQGSAPTTRLITLFSLFGNGQREPGLGRDPRPTGRGPSKHNRTIPCARQPGIRCTDPGRETLIHNSRFVPYATWHPMIVTLVFNRPLAGIDHTTASFPCHSVTVLP